MSPLVSVVIPLYNKEQYISKTIDSVLTQTLQDFELIIVNDGSTDQSLKIVESYSDSRIRIISQTNHGLSATRNRGIKEARTELLAFLDADDLWYPTFLEKILQLYSLYPDSGLYGTAYSVYDGEKWIHDIIQYPNLGERIFKSYFGEWAEARHPIIIASGFAAKKSALMRVGCYREDQRAGQDHELFGRIALYYTIAYSPSVCVRYNAGTANNGDVVRYIIEVPLVQYLKAHEIDEKTYISNPVDLNDYLNQWKIRIGGRNIYSGFRSVGRQQILSVTKNKNKLFFGVFLFMSFIPIPYAKISPKVVRSVLRIFHIVI